MNLWFSGESLLNSINKINQMMPIMPLINLLINQIISLFLSFSLHHYNMLYYRKCKKLMANRHRNRKRIDMIPNLVLWCCQCWSRLLRCRWDESVRWAAPKTPISFLNLASKRSSKILLIFYAMLSKKIIGSFFFKCYNLHETDRQDICKRSKLWRPIWRTMASIY